MKVEEMIKSTTALPLAKKTVLNLILTQNIVAERFVEVLRPYDLSGEQYNVLRILRGQKGKPANMCMIQERMVARTSNTTRLVDKLLAKALVTRQVCPNNRRKMEVMITEKGLTLLDELDPKVQHHEDTLASALNEDEIQQLNNLLDKYRTGGSII